jgi:hypothetical protein
MYVSGSAERGSLVTVFNCMSPTEQFILQLLVFPRKYMKLELMKGTPPGSIRASNPSGWVQSDIFTQRFLHIIISSNILVKADKILLS